MKVILLIFVLASAIVPAVQWRRHEATISTHTSAFEKGLVLIAPDQVASYTPALQPSQYAKREFVIFDATLYKQKPDLTRYGLKSIFIVYKYMLWPPGNDGADLPNRDLVRKLAIQASTSSGVATLDIEHWPLTGDPAVIKESIGKYETTVRWFKEAAPSVKVGFYGVAPLRNYWDAIQPINSPRYIGWQHSNDQIASIARLVDILFPSIYTFYNDQDGWSRYAARQIQEARRYGGGTPVYVFLWPQYHSANRTLGGTYLSPKYWRLELDTARKYADGVVIWGGSSQTWDDKATWWLETQRFMRAVVSRVDRRPPPNGGPRVDALAEGRRAVPRRRRSFDQRRSDWLVKGDHRETCHRVGGSVTL